ncbi:MAG: esterase/lipase family protein [Akkermansiaceae bacterium]
MALIKLPLPVSGALCLALIACTGPQVEILDHPVVETDTSRALISSGALERETRRTLRREALLSVYNRDSHAAVVELAKRYEAEPTPQRRLALAEMSSDTADVLTKSQPLNALGRYLDTAWLTRESATKTTDFSIETPERTLHEYACARVARLIREKGKGSADTVRVNGNLKTWTLALNRQGEEKVDPRGFDILVPASWLKTDGIDWKRVKQEGIGAAMVGQISATPEREELYPLIPKAGWTFPLNARIDFSGSRAELVVQDLMEKSTDSRGVSLAADFSASVSFVYYGEIHRMGRLEGLLRPGENKSSMGMYSVRPFEEDRIPLVLVHGLASRAEAWVPFINLLMVDPVVREKYQIVLFNYPTGVPIAKSAADLRDALSDYQKRNDPNRSNPKMRDMVILGHSMGGIISNVQVRTSGDRIFRAIFSKNMETLDLDAEEKAQLNRLGNFKANPDIDRAILLAAPLRGSAFASNRIGQFSASLIRFPFDLVDSVFGNIQVINGLTDLAQKASQRPLNSVTSLRPDNPFLGAIMDCPIRPGVKIHSIMGQRDPDDPKEEGSDGVVKYTSAHVPEAVSEVVVKDADHRGMVLKDETVAEVLRILRLHAGIGPR